MANLEKLVGQLTVDLRWDKTAKMWLRVAQPATTLSDFQTDSADKVVALPIDKNTNQGLFGVTFLVGNKSVASGQNAHHVALVVASAALVANQSAYFEY
ncbi:hypothetical protein LSA03nite_05650 [Latilactobacillus sakei subsp. carnosus]|nr:hypothetical protein LSA03nite_05650 [Latilactobacillus sakei subsp. carnosus]